MMFQFYFKSMGSSDALKNLSQRKLTDVIERFADGSGQVRMTFLSERGSQKILCTLRGWSGRVIHASASSDNMYAAVDAIAHKLESQLMRKKTRTQKHKRFVVLDKNSEIRNEDNETELDFWEDDRELAYAH